MIKKHTCKKMLSLTLAAGIAFSGSVGFADGLDTAYMDYLVQAISRQSADSKENFTDALRVALDSAETIEATKSIYETYFTDEQLEKLEENNITTAVVIDNLDALKTWSYTDRMALIDAAASLNKSAMISLNNKYSVTGGGGSGAGTSGSDIFAPTDEVKQTLTANGISTEKPVLGTIRTFKDMTGHWSESYVNLLSRAGVIAGLPDGRYMPEDTLTRAEVITMLVKAFSKSYTTLKPEKLALDLKAGDWHYDFMSYATYLNLFDTVNELAYPDEPLTREKTANILARMAMVLKLNPQSGESIQFKDVSSLSIESQEDLQWLTIMSVFSGYPDGTFKPNQVVTRAEASVLILKMMQLFYGSLI